MLKIVNSIDSRRYPEEYYEDELNYYFFVDCINNTCTDKPKGEDSEEDKECFRGTYFFQG